MSKKTHQAGSSSSSSSSSSSTLSASYLADITYGMEIERYNFCPDSRPSFAKDYAKQLEIEQMERVKFQLALPTDKDKLRAGNLCTVYKIENYEELFKQVKGQLIPAKINSMYLTQEERDKKKQEAMATKREGKSKEEAPLKGKPAVMDDLDIRNRIIEDFKKNPKKEIFQVRLDGEQDFRLLHLEEEKKDDYAWHNLFNIEFISSGAGIKRHEDFFAHFNNPGSKDNNEVRQTLDNFSTAAASIKKENGSHQNICLVVNRKNGDAYLYEFSGWAIRHFKPADPSKQVVQERHGAGKEEMMHVTHSLPIVRDAGYLEQLGNAFIGEGRAQQSTKKSSIEMAFPSKDDSIVHTSDDITKSRNNNQPLFKSPREYFVPGSNPLVNEYLEAAKQEKVLQPTSNRLDFIDADLEIYRKLRQELRKEWEDETCGEELQEELQPPQELEVLENTIIGLERIIKSYEGIGKGSRDVIRVFESHDEKFQLIYTQSFAGKHDVYHGLLEGRERSSLVKYIASVALGKTQASFPDKYLDSLTTAIYIATQQAGKALKKVTELQVESINEDDLQCSEEDQGTNNKDSLNDSTTQVSNKKKEDSKREDEGDRAKVVPVQAAQEESDSNPQGEGTLDHNGSNYWYVYTKAAMERMLALRINNAEVGAEHARIINPHYIFNEVNALAFIQDLVSQINVTYTETNSGIRPTLLIPVNINNQHWVGITVEFVDGKIKVTYMDSEGNAMPQPLNDGLKAELERAYPDSTVEITGKEVEYQKYNNCGLEVIENLVAAVAGKGARIDQEEVLEFHSELYEQYLIEKALEVEKALQKEKSINTLEVGRNSITKESSSTNQASREKTMNEIWDEAHSSNLGEEELRIMDAIWNQSQVHGTETTEGETRLSGIKNSISQSLSSLVNINPNDIISSLHSMAQLLSTGSSSRCGVEINTPGEPGPERLDTFTTNSTNVLGMPLRNGNTLLSETLSLREPMQTIGSVDESLAE